MGIGGIGYWYNEWEWFKGEMYLVLVVGLDSGGEGLDSELECMSQGDSFVRVRIEHLV